MKIANRNDIIILALVSDDQESTSESWSAGLPEVIAIHGEMWSRERCSVKPFEHPGSDNFAVPGEDILSYWLSCLNEALVIRRSGNSVATAIAAGIAAFCPRIYETCLQSICS